MFVTYPLETYITAFIAGVLPAVIWLWFWLKEDDHPEPMRRIDVTFLYGMLAVIIAIPLQIITVKAFNFTGHYVYIFLALIEEVLKYMAAFWGALRHRETDEPIDDMIYLITAALGFAGLENALFILGPLGQGEVLKSVIAGNMRFIGATLLHTISSATVGIFLAFSFYKTVRMRKIFLFMGLVLAVTLHTLFNLFIIESNTAKTLGVFAVVWVAIIVLLLFFEKIKHLKNNVQK
jgi:RsiW-degrading membrane proteinase PrsW (M82 family)